MNVIDKMSIGGIAFSLDPEARAALEQYLGKIQEFYRSKESGSEIVEGIEGRIAELLQEKRGSNEVVTRTDVERIIGIMGYPEEMDQPEEKASGAAAEPRERKEAKRLYRNPKQGILGGVCSGLADYFGIDVVLVRLIFVVLFALSFFDIYHGEWLLAMPLIYIILLFCIPAAKTVQERWAIKGDDGSVARVEKNVLSGDTAQVGTRSEFWKGFGRAIAMVVGVLLVICGIAGLVTLILGVVNGAEFTLLPRLWEDSPEFGHHVAMLLDIPWVYFCILAIIAIPFIGLLWGGIQLCFGLRSPKWHPWLILFILWVIAIVAVTVQSALTLFPLTV